MSLVLKTGQAHLRTVTNTLSDEFDVALEHDFLAGACQCSYLYRHSLCRTDQKRSGQRV